MKNLKVLTILSLLFYITTIFGQLQREIQHPDIAGRLFKNSGREATKPLGLPYLQIVFKDAKVTKINTTAPMRYNVYGDEFEFINPKNDTLVLDKIEEFSDLTFIATNTKYKLVNYTLENGKLNYGYLIDLYQKNDFGLFKKQTILLSEEKIAKTSMERSMPPQYSKIGDKYYLKSKNNISEFPDSKKRLSKIFPDKKELIEIFVKENKINFDKDADKIKIIDFLSNL